MRKRLNSWRRTLNTIRHMQPRQVWYFFLRRGIGARRVKPSTGNIVCRKVVIHPVLQLTHADGDFSAYEFTFLNLSLSFPRDAINWCPQEAQRLWRYNLHYFDYLRDPARPLTQKMTLIVDWTASNPQGSAPAWEPYTASLRIVNWCLFFWSLPAAQIPEQGLRGLYDQARWLERNLELHILANHYFENIKAMVFAALFFDDKSSVGWLRKFQRELIEQLREQMLSDGGHYERSPQYHCILLEDFLDLYALLSANAALVSADTLPALKTAIECALKFLSAIATPDDDIPLFNDSASGAAPRPSAIFAKADALGFAEKIQSTALIDLPVSGLYGWKSGGDYFLIDCGDIGPNYQPGHTHCDFLSFVLMIDGQWLVVDSGVYEYEPGSMRNYVRSTAAHNTVTIDDIEQSEIWGEFRVGRRALSLGAAIKQADNITTFEGAYRGFPASNSNIVHRRKVSISHDHNLRIKKLDITDIVEGNGTHLVRSLIHLHPDLTINLEEKNNGVIFFLSAKSIGNISCKTHNKFHIGEGLYCKEFGIRETNKVINIQFRQKLPITHRYCMNFLLS